MRLFKNRGDIYIPKTGKASTKEAKILFSLLIFIVIFTLVFVALLSHKYHSAAEFFGAGEVTATEYVYDEDTLPQISGKVNYLIVETDHADTNLHYLYLLQADKDNTAYKAAALSTDMKIDGSSVQDIYKQGGGAALQTKLTEYFGFEIDHYAVFDTDSFVEFTDKLGDIIYPSNSDIRFSGGGENDKYSIHINEGEQKIGGREITNLLRYFSNEKHDYFEESELTLRALTGLFNEKNFENAETLFRLFIKSSSTDITVRDFEDGKDGVMVFCKMSNDVTIYAVEAKYEKNVLTQPSLSEIKGYFNK